MMTFGKYLSTLRGHLFCDKWSYSTQYYSCRLCGQIATRRDLCAACERDLPRRTAVWRRHLPHVDRVWVAFNYHYPIRHLIQLGKYRGDLAALRLLGELCAADVPRYCDDETIGIVPVPIPARRLARRGFNQSVEIAKPIARCLSVRIVTDSVQRQAGLATQTSLDRNERWRNVRNSFVVAKAFDLDHAVIVDDVITTGATVSGLAAALRQAGAPRVSVIAVAAA